MNCEPGDLAVIVNPLSPNYGRFVNVLRAPEPSELDWWSMEGPTWIVEAIGAPLIVVNGIHCGLKAIRPFTDAALRPVRDPGEDAVDEIIQLLGSPALVTA